MNTHTYEGHAYLPACAPGDIARAIQTASPVIWRDGRAEFLEKTGYVHIGAATVTIQLNNLDTMVKSQIDSLNSALQRERADSQVRQNALLDQISKLQALDYVAA